MDEDAFVVGGILPALLRTSGGAKVLVAVHKVRDHFDVFLDVKNADGASPQILGDRGDSVALLDGKTRDRQVGAVEADQSDIRAVKCGDEGKMTARRSGRQHLPSKHCADRMRNRIVNVQQVEFVELRHLGHPGSEG